MLLCLALSGCSGSENTDSGPSNDLNDTGDTIVGLWDVSSPELDEPFDTLLHITADQKYKEYDLQDSNCYVQYDDGEIISLGDNVNGIEVYEVEFDESENSPNYTLYLDPKDSTNNVLFLQRGAFLDGLFVPRVENISPLDIVICEQALNPR